MGHALQAYTASFTAGKAPPPLPLYLEQGQEKLQPARYMFSTKLPLLAPAHAYQSLSDVFVCVKVLGSLLNKPVVGARDAAPTTDVNFLLLELFCGGTVRADGAFLAQLLAPTAHTPELVNYMLPWLLLQMLQGIHALPTQNLAPQVG